MCLVSVKSNVCWEKGSGGSSIVAQGEIGGSLGIFIIIIGKWFSHSKRFLAISLMGSKSDPFM